MAKPQYRWRVLGDQRNRKIAGLEVVLPQALDLVDQSSYTATISETGTHPQGVVHVKKGEWGVFAASYHPNPNYPDEPMPAWVKQLNGIARSVDKELTWLTPI